MSDPLVKPKLEIIGNEKTPVIIIDDCASSTAKLISDAVNHGSFVPDEHTYYPGIRSKLPEDYVIACLKPLLKYLHAIYKIPPHLKPYPKDNYFSLITTEPEDLTLVQSLPHFDTTNPYLIAIIHYLSEGEHGGFGFFRHKATQYEYIDESRKSRYFNALDRHLSQLPDDKLSYCTRSHVEFDCYKEVDYKPNRLLIFPGYMLHSALVNLEKDINPDPIVGRLTANMFVEFK